eukprot:GFUD01086873.1.p1 GENE.GFUD01086873.1~~GFUD01086873.1.p1  ORF type:complete len:487 (+),score=95.87 GFUD01086873.1:125-1585(+)
MEDQRQYCLKWNNHPRNISTVFDRLRLEELFVDVTLATSDRQIIRAHRVLLSAGSGYLEKVLAMNPSDHPTVVLSNIRYKELKLLVDFMYSGEIAVDQQQFPILLEAAKALKIRGLYEDSDETEVEDEDVAESKCNSLTGNSVSELTVTKNEPKEVSISAKTIEEARPACPRKRSHSEESEEEPIQSPDAAEKIDDESSFEETPAKLYKPMYGVSNAVWMMSQNGKTSSSDSAEAADKEKDIPDIPNLMNFASSNLLCQTEPQPSSKAMMNHSSLNEQFLQAMQLATCTNPYLNMAAMQKPLDLLSPTFNGSFTGMSQFKNNLSPNSKAGLLNQCGAPVRRYKQYSEDSLQAALKEIMNGQSINRSSMKHNIPARTLRDWMKRLNIKSVFTHHSHNKERTTSQDGTEDESMSSISPEPHSSIDLTSPVFGASTNAMFTSPQNGSAFPGMKINPVKDEDEIDDDEDRTLKIDEGPSTNLMQIALEAN